VNILKNQIIDLLKNENCEIIEIYENSICFEYSNNFDENQIFEFETDFANKIENIVKISIIVNNYEKNKFELQF
jgi:hypothetical protein